PGNVRELEHFINRATLKAKAQSKPPFAIKLNALDAGELVNEPMVSTEVQTNTQTTSVTDLKLATNQFQRKIIQGVLTQHAGNWAASARALNTDRSNLMRLAKRLGISVEKTVIKGK
ncbi:MAG: nitric oxide reductase transcription regulator, partial [Psychrobium sp.]